MYPHMGSQMLFLGASLATLLALVMLFTCMCPCVDLHMLCLEEDYIIHHTLHIHEAFHLFELS